jgi:hypothetical protein
LNVKAKEEVSDDEENNGVVREAEMEKDDCELDDAIGIFISPKSYSLAEKVSSCQAIATYNKVFPDAHRKIALFWRKLKHRFYHHCRNLKKQHLDVEFDKGRRRGGERVVCLADDLATPAPSSEARGISYRLSRSLILPLCRPLPCSKLSFQYARNSAA